MNIIFLIVNTILCINMIIGIIIVVKDIRKRVKKNNYSNEIIIKLRMLHIAMIVCALIFLAILLFDYLSFLKMI